MIGFFVMCAVIVAIGILILKMVNSRAEKKAMENIHAPTIEIGNLLREGDPRFVIRSPAHPDEMRYGFSHVVIEYGGKKSTFYEDFNGNGYQVVGDFDWMNDYEVDYIYQIAYSINYRKVEVQAAEGEARIAARKETARQMMIDSLKK